MPTFEITSPDGRKFRVNGPDGATKQDALDQVRARVAAEDIKGGGDDLAYRSSILPLGKTKEGNIVPAIPGAIKSLIDLPQQFISAGAAGPPGSREVTEAAIAPAAETALAASPTPAAARLALPTAEKFTTEDLHAAGTAAYKAAENSGIQIKPEAFRNMVSHLIPELKSQGFDKDIQTKAAAAVRRLAEELRAMSPKTETQAETKMVDGKRVVTGLKEIEKPAPPMSISEFDTIRKVAQAGAKAIEPDDRRVAGIIKGAMDDFLAGLTKDDVIGGDVKGGTEALTQARELWSRYSKSSEIDRLFENAALDAPNFNAAGYENALRNQFKSLAKNQNRLRKYSAEEQAAIKAVAKGSKLQTVMTKLGKFSPTAGFFSGVLTGEIALHAAANPALLAIPGIGAVARFAATRMRSAVAERARTVVAGGKSAGAATKRELEIKRLSLKNRASLLGGAGFFGQ